MPIQRRGEPALSLPEKEGTATAALLDVRAVAALLSCSARHVIRLSNAGRMPAPIRLGTLLRWSRATIEQWVADACPGAEAVVR